MPGRPKTGQNRHCQNCGAEFYVPQWKLRESRYRGGLYCSRTCHYEAMRGRPSAQRKVAGSRRVRPDGYIEISLGDGGRWVLEHRYVMEQDLGRPLLSTEHVHHRNEDKQDNRPENLEILTNEEHGRAHGGRPRTQVTLTCHWCGTTYSKKASRATESKCCSNACRMQAMWQARRDKAAERKKT